MAVDYGHYGLTRDFSDEAREILIQTVKEVNESQWSEVTDYIGDSIQKIKDYMAPEDKETLVGLEGELLNSSEYYEKIVDKNNATEKEINQIFDDVIAQDEKGKARLEEIYEGINKQTGYIQKLADMINPNNYKFQAEQMAKELEESYRLVLEKMGIVMNNIGEEIFGNDEYTLAGELLFALAGEEEIEYSDYENMTESERQQYIGSVANILQELALYLTLGAEFPRIEIPIGGDAYIYYELKTSKEFKENEQENRAQLQLILSNQLESIASYTLHTDKGSMGISSDGVTVEGEQGEGNVRNILEISGSGGIASGIIYEYDEGSVKVSGGAEYSKLEMYIKAESEMKDVGTVTTTIGMGQQEDEFPDEVPDWVPAEAYYLEEQKEFIENPIDYFFYSPSPLPFFW